MTRAAPPSSDGRHRRSERSRDRVAEALLALVREGEVRPSADAVAERAGVSRRTVFNRFKNLGELVRELHDRQVRDVRAAMPPIPREGDLEDRLHVYLEAYTALLEEVAPVRVATLAFPGPPEERRQLARRVREVQAILSSGPLALLRDAGVTLPAGRRTAVVALLDPLVYRAMRVQQRLSRERARRALAESILSLVPSTTAAPGSLRAPRGPRMPT